MTIKIICNGCEAELVSSGRPFVPTSNIKALVVTGNAEHFQGVSYAVPQGRFHLCGGCAGIAFEHLIKVKTIGE